jgi:hypothetical protein
MFIKITEKIHMLKSMSKLAIAGLAATLGATAIAIDPAAAAVFDLGGSNAAQSSFILNSDGIGLTVKGLKTLKSNGAIDPAKVVRRDRGMGVNSTVLGDPDTTARQVDGSGSFTEALVLGFDQKVNIVRATFAAVQGDDDFSLFVDGVQKLLNEDIPGSGDNVAYSFNPQFKGTSFKFAALENNDDFFLRSVEVSKVPEPMSVAALVLVGGTLVGTLKKKQAA